MLPDPIIFSKPLFIWLGMLAFLLLLTQIFLGIALVRIGNQKVKFIHTKIVWVILAIVIIFHAIYGIQLYFLR